MPRIERREKLCGLELVHHSIAQQKVVLAGVVKVQNQVETVSGVIELVFYCERAGVLRASDFEAVVGDSEFRSARRLGDCVCVVVE